MNTGHAQPTDEDAFRRLYAEHTTPRKPSFDDALSEAPEVGRSRSAGDDGVAGGARCVVTGSSTGGRTLHSTWFESTGVGPTDTSVSESTDDPPNGRLFEAVVSPRL